MTCKFPGNALVDGCGRSQRCAGWSRDGDGRRCRGDRWTVILLLSQAR